MYPKSFFTSLSVGLVDFVSQKLIAEGAFAKTKFLWILGNFGKGAPRHSSPPI
tara:strand:- start:353 stop:511 length:159 start_codon:yes stop_codon:yes gene_type:complete